MSKSAFYNPERAKQEEEIKKVLKGEDEKRNLYFERLKKDKNFQKYVVEELIKKNIESLTDTRLLIDALGKPKEQLADLVMTNIKASQTLSNILNNLL